MLTSWLSQTLEINPNHKDSYMAWDPGKDKVDQITSVVFQFLWIVDNSSFLSASPLFIAIRRVLGIFPKLMKI